MGFIVFVCLNDFLSKEEFLGSKYPFFPMLLLLLGRFSRVRLCATPETAAHQAPPSLGFSKHRILSYEEEVVFFLLCFKTLFVVGY